MRVSPPGSSIIESKKSCFTRSAVSISEPPQRLHVPGLGDLLDRRSRSQGEKLVQSDFLSHPDGSRSRVVERRNRKQHKSLAHYNFFFREIVCVCNSHVFVNNKRKISFLVPNSEIVASVCDHRVQPRSEQLLLISNSFARLARCSRAQPPSPSRFLGLIVHGPPWVRVTWPGRTCNLTDLHPCERWDLIGWITKEEEPVELHRR